MSMKTDSIEFLGANNANDYMGVCMCPAPKAKPLMGLTGG